MDFKKINFQINWIYIILISIGLILFSGYLIVNEILEAKRECNNTGGDYETSFTLKHFCNGKRFVKYNSCDLILNELDCNLIWTYENLVGKINVSEFIK